MPAVDGNDLIVKVEVPTSSGTFPLELRAGRSIVLVGANGAGKTRLGVFLETSCPADKTKRIAAHRSLVLSDKISAISFDRAMKGLQFGYIDGEPSHRLGHRWQNKPAVAMLNDFEFLLQALFAETSRVAIKYLEARHANPEEPPPETVLWKLKGIWERLLPHRNLRIQELGVLVFPEDNEDAMDLHSTGYPGSEMSDGERVIFYMLGHCLLASPGSIIIVDEPELHIHKAILGRLWDAIEAERMDCTFVYITHDLDFLVSRPTATKLLIASYSPEGRWQIETLPKDTGLPERVLSELVGSRQSILFVEGTRGSLDTTIYQSVFPNYTIEPIGSCDAVFHAVSSFRKNPSLHRISAQGIVDADGRDAEQAAYLKKLGVFVIPVAEVENLLLLPNVFKQLAIAMAHTETQADGLLERLTSAIMATAVKDTEAASIRFALRRLDTELKKLALPNRTSIEDLGEEFLARVKSFDPTAVANEFKNRLSSAIEMSDLETVLSLYDNKGLLNIAAEVLGLTRSGLLELLSRLLAGKDAPVTAEIRAALPTIG